MTPNLLSNYQQGNAIAMSSKKIYLLIGMTTASVFLTGISAQAQTTESPKENTLIIAENLEKIKPSFESTNAPKESEFIAQFSVPQNGTTQTAPLDNTTPTTQPAPLDNTIPPTTPSTQTPPSDGNNRPFGDVDPGRATRSGSSYIGVGGNIGIGGDTGIGEGSFSIISKVGLTRNFSARPSVLFGDNTTILLPVTVDFPSQNVETTRFNVAPYVGGGAVISTGDDSDVGVLLTGGVDVPINSQFTATAGVNVGFVDETDVGVILGIGYNFSGL
jgi:hypothetical protein